MSRRFATSLFTATVVSVAAGSAHAAFFSFASDNDHTSWTFRGGSPLGGPPFSQILDAADASDPFNLNIDDNNGPAIALSIATEFQASFNLSYVSSAPLGPPGVFVHIYQAVGSFAFLDPANGNLLLRCDFGQASPAVFSAPGGASSWSSTGASLGSDTFADVTYTVTQDLINTVIGLGANPATYGLIAGTSGGPDDFGFDLTVINTLGVAGVTLGNDFLPIERWDSEGSYSGSAFNFIPTPAAAALLGMGGLLVGRRRRN